MITHRPANHGALGAIPGFKQESCEARQAYRYRVAEGDEGEQLKR